MPLARLWRDVARREVASSVAAGPMPSLEFATRERRDFYRVEPRYGTRLRTGW